MHFYKKKSYFTKPPKSSTGTTLERGQYGREVSACLWFHADLGLNLNFTNCKLDLSHNIYKVGIMPTTLSRAAVIANEIISKAPSPNTRLCTTEFHCSSLHGWWSPFSSYSHITLTVIFNYWLLFHTFGPISPRLQVSWGASPTS